MSKIAVEKKTKERAKKLLEDYCCECAMAFDTPDFKFDCTLEKNFEDKRMFTIYEHENEVEIYSSDREYDSIEECVKECKRLVEENFKIY